MARRPWGGGDELRGGKAFDAALELVGDGEGQLAHLGEGLHPGLASRPFRHDEDPDGLDRTVPRLGATIGCSAGCLDRVDRVGLTGATAILAVGPVDFDDFDAGSGQEPGQSGAIGTRASTPTFPTIPNPVSQESRAE